MAPVGTRSLETDSGLRATDEAALISRLMAAGPDRIAWLVLFVVSAACFHLSDRFPALRTYPDAWTLPVQDWMNSAMEWFVATVGGLFGWVTWVLEWPLNGLMTVLTAGPWFATVILLGIVVFRLAGIRAAALVVASLLYMAAIGYWDESMRTLALVALSVPMSVMVGFMLGVVAFLSSRVERVILPVLSFMQTVPAFAYLIPALLLLGFGPVVGLVVAVIYASPPFARNLLLGLRKVPRETIEAGITSGASPGQLFWQIRLRAATGSILIGINQTTMAALNMVIIASMIGSTADIGWEVLSTMRKAQFGESLLAGLVIVLMATTLDQTIRRFAARIGQPGRAHTDAGKGGRRVRFASVLVLCVAAAGVAAMLWPALADLPDGWTINAAPPINAALTAFITGYSDLIELVKQSIAFYFMMPLRLGLQETISPFTWGFEFSPFLKSVYLLAGVAAASMLYMLVSWRASTAVICLWTVLYFGFTQIPWTVFLAAVSLLAWQAGGARCLAMALTGMGFILVSGLWEKAMLSVYLTTAAVAAAFFMGVVVGILAARSDLVSASIRPINDALQTMPMFVFLIPVIMIFGIGEFAALVAIVLYAVVPAIRYTEHGLRNVPHSPVEASMAMGCTSWQRMVNVELPLAFPEIMLGLNQTIMFALAMLVIAALVGTSGLGQEIYIALSAADFGAGISAGLGMAMIALTADSIIQSWANRRKHALGL
jgi:glycine betaine/proline transport system permease protein